MVPKKIWCYWNDRELPKQIAAIQSRWSAQFPDFEIKVVTPDNLSRYLPDLRIYKRLGPAHRSDQIRLNLLEAYGGVWIDISTIINDSGPIREKIRRVTEGRLQLGIYTINYGAPQDRYRTIDTWFIIAPLRSPFLRLWRTEFESACKLGLKLYCKYIVVISKINSMKIKYPYLTLNLCAQKVLQQIPDFENFQQIDYDHSEEGPFSLHCSCHWNPEKMKEMLLTDQARQLPMIKLRGGDRRIMENELEIYLES